MSPLLGPGIPRLMLEKVLLSTTAPVHFAEITDRTMGDKFLPQKVPTASFYLVLLINQFFCHPILELFTCFRGFFMKKNSQLAALQLVGYSRVSPIFSPLPRAIVRERKSI